MSGVGFSDGLDEATLTVLLDVRLPAAYLALGPAIAFGRRRGLEINWLPCRVAPLRPPSSPGPDDDRSILHRRHRAQMIAREIATYAEVQGLVISDYYRDGDVEALDLGWLWLRGRYAPAALEHYLEAAFAAYWAGGIDPQDVPAIARLVGDAGGDAAAFETWAATDGPAVAAQAAEALSARGLAGSPAYLVKDEFFQGRQHLPMIGWILDGRVGRGPI